jgi:hypothetical protein
MKIVRWTARYLDAVYEGCTAEEFHALPDTGVLMLELHYDEQYRDVKYSHDFYGLDGPMEDITSWYACEAYRPGSKAGIEIPDDEWEAFRVTYGT